MKAEILPLLVFAALALSQAVSAYTIVPIYSPAGAMCTQLSTTHLYCEDGKGIDLAFSITARYPDYYGPATVYASTGSNSTQPQDVYGNKCSVSSGSINTCFITISPVSLFRANGTVTRHIYLNIVPSKYPQKSFPYTLNVTITHYLNGYDALTLSFYQQALSYYSYANVSYSGYCGTYGMCNQSIGYQLAVINRQISGATASLANDSAAEAYSNLTIANATINAAKPLISSYLGNSQAILQNIITANMLLQNTTAMYNRNYIVLQNCTLPKKVNAANQISSGIKSLSAFNVTYTKSGSLAYLNMSRNLSDLAGNDIQTCTVISKTGVLSPATTPGVPTLNGLSFYLIGIVVVGLIILLTIRHISDNGIDLASAIKGRLGKVKEPEIPKVQPDASAEKAEGAEPKAGEPGAAQGHEAEGEPATPSLEESFDSWLKGKIGKK